MQRFTFITTILVVMILSACTSNDDGMLGYEKCISDGGDVVTQSASDGTSVEFCSITTSYVFDDGEQEFTEYCPLENYYYGTCDIEAEADNVEGLLLLETSNDKTIHRTFYEKVVEIMQNIKNTGYGHNSNDNFSLVPNYNELNVSHSEYNLFLDCSGFVGYYVVQGIAPKLYKDALPSHYKSSKSTSPYCQDRPLAADFADVIANAPELSTENSVIAATMSDADGEGVCWGQVKHIKNAREGDVLVYKHLKNVTDEIVFCRDIDTNVTTTAHLTTGNTGHILFIMGRPYLSKMCNEYGHCTSSTSLKRGEAQYVVPVADSTTAKHMFDTRDYGYNNSQYKENHYTAWAIDETKESTRVNGTGIVQKCSDASYHASCLEHNLTVEKNITIATRYNKHPTGIGMGKMYVSPSMKSYRNSYKTLSVHSEEQSVFIGRPVRCP